MDAFISTYGKPSSQISFMLSSSEKDIVKKNQEFLTSIIKCVEFCGRQGLALKGHRDDSTTVDKKHQGNFRSLLDFRIDAGDKVLEEHLAKDPKNASYISKTTQKELLDCVKKYILDEIIKEIKEQPVGPMFSIQADEVTDISNKEQMALLLRYLKDGKPIERLVEYILCESITGVALCEDIQRTLSGLNLDLQNTVSQTYDGATNFSGQIKGCAALFQQTVPHATYFHCSNHDLNLALCHTCKDIPEIRNMLSCVTEVGLFFKYSPKRSHVLEATLLEYNMMKNVDKRINTAKIKLFCATRWVERHLVLEEIIALYEPLLTTLQKIATE